MPPLVSTITPCFRMGRYLKLFLEKLPEQTIFDQLEVVLDHNDPAPEEIELVHAFMDQYPGRIRHIITSPVQPIGQSMNTCIREARGKYLAIWNVDDLRTPNSLAMQVRALEADPTASVSLGTYNIVSSFGESKGERVDNRSLPLEEHQRGMTIGPFFMFRAALCDKAGLFDEQLKSGADFDFALRLLRHGPPVFTDDSLGYYLNEGKGASTRPNSLQPVEADVIYTRYGIWDKLGLERLPDVMKYDIQHIRIDGLSHPVATFFPDYEAEMQRRNLAWFPVLAHRHAFAPRRSLAAWMQAGSRYLARNFTRNSCN